MVIVVCHSWGSTPGSVMNSASSSVSWCKSADDTPSSRATSDYLPLTWRCTLSRWRCSSVKFFYTHRLLKLMSHWKRLSFGIGHNIRHICTQWDHYMENTKCGVSIIPIQLPPYAKNVWSKTNTVCMTFTKSLTISLTKLCSLAWVQRFINL